MAPPLYFITHVAPYRDGPAGVHGVLEQAAVAMAEIASLAGLDPVTVRDVADLPPVDLEQEGILALFTIGETPWSGQQKATILNGLRSGRMNVLSLHSATDSCRAWEEYGKIVGGRFDGHPWTATVELEVLDHDHPATSHLPDRWKWHDEIYLFSDLRPDARILIRVGDGQLDMSVDDARRPDCGFPVTWCFEEGDGRAFQTAIGHFPGAWESPVYLRHVAGGLAWLRERAA